MPRWENLKAWLSARWKHIRVKTRRRVGLPPHSYSRSNHERRVFKRNELHKQLQLFDRIYDLTFTSNSGTIVTDQDYKPPALLQLNKATRRTFATCYYGENVFRLRLAGPIVDWLEALEEDTRYMIQHVMLEAETPVQRRTVWKSGARRWIITSRAVAWDYAMA